MKIALNKLWLAFTVSVILLVNRLEAQMVEIDSLRILINKQRGTKKIDALNALSFRLILLDYKLAIDPIEQAFTLAKGENYLAGLAESNVNKGICEYLRGNKDASLHLLKDAGTQAKKAGAKGTEGYALVQIGNLYRAQGTLDSAKYWYDQSYLILKDSLNPWQLSVLYKNLGIYYGVTSQPFRELDFLNRSLAIRQKLADKILTVDILTFLSKWHTAQYNLAQAEAFLNQTQKYIGTDGSTEVQYQINYQRAIINFSKGNYKDALVLFNQAEEFYFAHGNLVQYATLLIDFAQVLNEVGSYDLSLKYGFEALKICTEKTFLKNEVRSQLVIGWNYYHLRQLQYAHDFTNKVLTSARENNFKTEEATASDLNGLILNLEGKFPKALTSFEKGLMLRTELEDKKGVGRTLTKIGEAYAAMGKLKMAFDYQQQSLNMLEPLHDQAGLVWTYYNMGSVYAKMGDFEKASIFLNKAEKTARLVTRRIVLVEIYKTRRNILITQGKLAEAMTYSIVYEKLKDSVASATITNRVSSIQSLYELEQSTYELELLKKSKQVQEDQITIQKAEIHQQEFIIAAISVGMMIVGVLAYLFFGFFRKTKNLNGKLQEQNEEIQAQAEELTETNSSLNTLNRNLAEKQEEIQTQAEELTEANQLLTIVNMELAEKSEELASQSEELTESNDMISRLNEYLEANVSERTRALEQTYKELDTFFYRSSHDFRRPLTTFMGLAEVAKITVKDTNALDLFSKVKETAVNLDRMLIKLQSISDVSAEQFVVKPISLQTVLEDACRLYHQEILDANIKVLVKASVLPELVSYPAFLKIIVENLLENSIRFRSAVMPQIFLEASEVGGGVQLIVRDNGIGIEEIYSDRVFEMFFRGSEHSKGNGLGLYIVKKAVEKMNGTVTFSSHYGEGTTVTVRFPFLPS